MMLNPKVEVLSGIQRSFIMSRQLVDVTETVTKGLWLQPDVDGNVALPATGTVTGPFYMALSDTVQPSVKATGALALLMSPAYIATDKHDIAAGATSGSALTVIVGGLLSVIGSGTPAVTGTVVGYLDHLEGDFAFVKTI